MGCTHPNAIIDTFELVWGETILIGSTCSRTRRCGDNVSGIPGIGDLVRTLFTWTDSGLRALWERAAIISAFCEGFLYGQRKISFTGHRSTCKTSCSN